MEYTYSLTNPRLIEQNPKIPTLLPSNMSYKSEDGSHMISINIPGPSSDEQAFSLVNRELYRFYFLTGINCQASFSYKKSSSGSISVTNTINMLLNIRKDLPDNLARQVWNGQLQKRLCLWSQAHEQDVSLSAKIILLFQIIEDSNPKFPVYKYSNQAQAPDPITECKLLRDLVSHQGSPNNSQLNDYCRYLGCPTTFLDPSIKSFCDRVSPRVHVVEQEASKIIDNSITRTL